MTHRRIYRCSPSTADAGFSLIEIVISLMLLTFILLTTQTALKLGQRTWQIADELSDSDAASATLNFLEQRLTQTMPLYERQGDGRLRIAFRGAADSISFIAPTALGPEGGGLYRFEIGTSDASEGGRKLMLRWALYQPPPAGSNFSERVLLSDVSDFSLRYFGRSTSGEPPAWASQWSRLDAFPDLIEIRAVTQNRGATNRALAVVELRLRPQQ